MLRLEASERRVDVATENPENPKPVSHNTPVSLQRTWKLLKFEVFLSLGRNIWRSFIQIRTKRCPRDLVASGSHDPTPSSGSWLSMNKYTPELHYQDPTKSVQACPTTSCYCTLRASQFGGGSFLPNCQIFTFTHSARSSSSNFYISALPHRFWEFQLLRFGPQKPVMSNPPSLVLKTPPCLGPGC